MDWKDKKILVYMLLYADDMLTPTLQNNTKLIWQIRAFEKMGMDVWYVLFAKEGILLCNKEKKIKIGATVAGERGFIHRHFMNRALLRVLNQYGPFDYAYVRKMVSLPSFEALLRRLHGQKTKVILEIPTYSTSKISEDAQSGRRFRVAIAPAMRQIERRCARSVDLYSVIGEPAQSIFGVRAVNINNGMNALNADELPVRNFTPKNGEYHLLALGHMREYHGIRRIVEGMHQYYENGGSADVILHVVGLDADGCLARVAEQAKSCGLEDKIRLEGFQTGEALDRICDQCCVAFCALAYYIKGGIVGNELKTREYMSRGIPFVMAVPDASVPENARYVLRVENDASAINISEIIDFSDRVSADPAVIEEMRQYALKNMTWIPQLEKVLRAVDAEK